METNKRKKTTIKKTRIEKPENVLSGIKTVRVQNWKGKSSQTIPSKDQERKQGRRKRFKLWTICKFYKSRQ